MQILTGTVRISKFGGVIAIIKMNKNVPGYLFLQSPSYDLLPDLIQKGIEFHLESEGCYEDWIFANLSDIENGNLGFSQTPFNIKTHKLITRTSICEPASPRENENFVSYSFGNVRVTLPKFNDDQAKPELLNEVFTIFSKAISEAPRTAEHAERLISKIFTNPAIQ